VDDAALQLGMRAEQLPVGLQTTHDVLGQLGAVDTQDHLTITDQVQERGSPSFDIGLARPLPEEIGVGA
jgi:hypothetical protein